MSVLAALVGALTLLTGFNVALLFAVLRRLREIENRGAPAPAQVTPAAGTRVGPWSAALTNGAAVTDVDLGPDAVVLFLSPGCGPCARLVGQVADDPAVLGGGPALAVVVGDVPGAHTYADVLPHHLPLAYAGEHDPIVTAFGGVDAFPTVVVVRGGVVRASSHDLHAVDAPAPV
jgi:hypothetical protein